MGGLTYILVIILVGLLKRISGALFKVRKDIVHLIYMKVRLVGSIKIMEMELLVIVQKKLVFFPLLGKLLAP